MKTLKLIGFMLLMANFVIAQNGNITHYGDFAGEVGANNTNIGFKAGQNVSGTDNTFIGSNTASSAGITKNSVGIGKSALGAATGNSNVGIGINAGLNAVGGNSIFVGKEAGRLAYNSGNVGIGNSTLWGIGGDATSNTGSNNLAIGTAAGQANRSGNQNVYIGGNAGYKNKDGNYNLCVGNSSGSELLDGDNNVFLGKSAGTSLTNGNGNVFIGPDSGTGLNSASDQLYIQNSNDILTPLIYGDFATKQVGIGTSDVPQDDNGAALYMLAVAGKTITEEVQVMLSDQWPDYVFAKDYKLMPLIDLEAEIETLGHLPGVPSAEEVEENGHALGQMDAILLEKIEELTLHLIDMNKEMEKLRERNETLETRLSEVEEK